MAPTPWQKASCRHYLHEPRRRPQSTFIVVRHLHFLGNRGFGARNELCSHIDYSPLFSGLNGERALVVACAAAASLDRRAGGRNRLLILGANGGFSAFSRVRGCLPPDTLSCRLPCPPWGWGRYPARGRFMRVALASVPEGAMDRHPAGGRIARPVGAPIAIAWSDGVVIRAVAAVGSSCSVSCMAICPSVDACNAHGC